ncbi:hypothetical protein F5Y17DRAFT_273957 [Xylariaceae sp. FL0594]|nr:hypothetical protein F5Y17DRAFT_273957 [Xylariaceae sp. FL0594]
MRTGRWDRGPRSFLMDRWKGVSCLCRRPSCGFAPRLGAGACSVIAPFIISWICLLLERCMIMILREGGLQENVKRRTNPPSRLVPHKARYNLSPLERASRHSKVLASWAQDTSKLMLSPTERYPIAYSGKCIPTLWALHNGQDNKPARYWRLTAEAQKVMWLERGMWSTACRFPASLAPVSRNHDQRIIYLGPM